MNDTDARIESLHKKITAWASHVKRQKLSRGLNLVGSTFNAALPVPMITVALALDVGSINEMESDRLSGIAHAIEHMAFKNTQNMCAGVIDLTAHTLGLGFNAFTSFETVCFHFTCHSLEQVGLVSKVLFEMAFHTEVMTNDLASEMSTIVDELNRRENALSAALWKLSRHTLMPGAPQRDPIGTMDALLEMKASDLQAFFDAHFAPHRAVLSVCASTPDMLQASMERATQEWDEFKWNRPQAELKPSARTLMSFLKTCGTTSGVEKTTSTHPECTSRIVQHVCHMELCGKNTGPQGEVEHRIAATYLASEAAKMLMTQFPGTSVSGSVETLVPGVVAIVVQVANAPEGLVDFTCATRAIRDAYFQLNSNFRTMAAARLEMLHNSDQAIKQCTTIAQFMAEKELNHLFVEGARAPEDDLILSLDTPKLNSLKFVLKHTACVGTVVLEPNGMFKSKGVFEAAAKRFSEKTGLLKALARNEKTTQCEPLASPTRVSVPDPVALPQDLCAAALSPTCMDIGTSTFSSLPVLSIIFSARFPCDVRSDMAEGVSVSLSSIGFLPVVVGFADGGPIGEGSKRLFSSMLSAFTSQTAPSTFRPMLVRSLESLFRSPETQVTLGSMLWLSGKVEDPRTVPNRIKKMADDAISAASQMQSLSETAIKMFGTDRWKWTVFGGDDDHKLPESVKQGDCEFGPQNMAEATRSTTPFWVKLQSLIPGSSAVSVSGYLGGVSPLKHELDVAAWMVVQWAWMQGFGSVLFKLREQNGLFYSAKGGIVCDSAMRITAKKGQPLSAQISAVCRPDLCDSLGRALVENVIRSPPKRNLLGIEGIQAVMTDVLSDAGNLLIWHHAAHLNGWNPKHILLHIFQTPDVTLEKARYFVQKLEDIRGVLVVSSF
jgi:predicted Zn-dependent peptidase